jgi:hypothetical protein
MTRQCEHSDCPAKALIKVAVLYGKGNLFYVWYCGNHYNQLTMPHSIVEDKRNETNAFIMPAEREPQHVST